MRKVQGNFTLLPGCPLIRHRNPDNTFESLCIVIKLQKHYDVFSILYKAGIAQSVQRLATGWTAE
jgi:hypothetical protein